MDKNAVFKYVEFAREELQKLTKQKAFEYGITDKGAEAGLKVVNGNVLSKSEYLQREALIDLIKSKAENKAFSEGYELVIEEVSYTWFNRFIALRFMEVNGYLPSHTRVFSDESGEFNPQIIKEALNVDLYGLDKLKVSEMVQDNKTEELYKYLIILQCNALSKPMPRMFEKIDNYTELLFPNGLLKKGSIIDRLVTDIPEDNWKEQVQIIGWMYQFYISKKKNEVFASKKTITKNTIGAVTQLFTPDWIVRYMVENSIGRIWVEANPDTTIKLDMKYYVDEAKQSEEVKTKLEEIRYKNINPEDIKIIEPCCGSGHILIYCFDLLYKMYVERGYSQRDIATLILKNNLWGLDVDNRASQLAYFSVMMKARSVDRQYLTRDVIQQPKIYEIIDSQQIIKFDYEELLKEHNFSSKSISIVKYLVSTFKDGKVVGSLLKVNRYDFNELAEEINEKNRTEVPNIFEQDAWDIVLHDLKKLVILAIVLSSKYDVLITNPPYLGSSSLEQVCKDYAARNYPNTKMDMFAMFMETSFVKINGYTAMINMHSWMFLTSYAKFRSINIQNSLLISLLHLGARAFESIGGEIVQTCAFVSKNSKNINSYDTLFFRLVDSKSELGKRDEFLNNRKNILFIKKTSEFFAIPESPYSYWVSNEVLNDYKTLPLLGNLVPVKKGVDTGDNDKYLRFWWEIEKHSFNYFSNDYKWVLYQKGGEYRKWFGNNFYVVWWKNDGYDLKHSKANIRSPHLYFRDSITWTAMGNCTYRYSPFKSIFDSSGSSMFPNTGKEMFYYLGLMNSTVMSHFLSIKNSTLSNGAGTIAMLPVFIDERNYDIISSMAEKNYLLCKREWDSYEVSFDFGKHPLLSYKSNLLSDCFDYCAKIRKELFDIVKTNEENINKIFAEDYSLTNELNVNVLDKNISIRKIEKSCEIKSLISYIIGTSFGRYSIKIDGLILASGTIDFSNYSEIIPDSNNIIPILDDGYDDDDVMNKIVEFVSKVYGEDTLEENLKFIADALGGNGTSREVIHNYMINGFYKEHCKIYQKRPIYWLFDAGKQNSFKALIYMHRYTPDLLAKMRTDYILPLMDKYSSRIEYLEKEVPTLIGIAAKNGTKELEKLRVQYKELSEYEPKIHHLADEKISIDLDDGVKHNYELFKDVLASIK